MEKAVEVKLRQMKLKEAAEKPKKDIEETLPHMDFPSERGMKIRSNNAIERINRNTAHQSSLTVNQSLCLSELV